MTREETKQAVKVMQAFIDGKEIEVSHKGDNLFSRIPCENTKIKAIDIIWDWAKYDYRIKPEPIPATEEELKRMDNDEYMWFKRKSDNYVTWSESFNRKDAIKYFIYNPGTKCWEDWSEK